MAAPPVAAGCYGKLPVTGDFLRHHPGGATVLEWERWLEAGLSDASQRLGRGVKERLASFSAFRFVFPGRRSDTLLVGAIGPGRDRSGRLFPFSVFVFAGPA